MKENSPQLLSVSYETALEVLNAVVKHGFELRKIIRTGSIRETPPDLNTLERQRIELQNWIKYSYRDIDKLLSEKSLIKGFSEFSIKEDLFNIVPEDQDDTGIFSPRRKAATHLATIIEDKTDELLALLIYVELYGEDQRILALRILSEAALEKIKQLLSGQAFIIHERTDKYWEGIFTKITDEKKDAFTALKERLRETEQNPIRPTARVDQGFLGKDGYFTTIDDLKGLIAEYESAFIKMIGLKPSLLLDDWNVKSPKYDYTDVSRCYEELGDYIAQLMVNLKSLPYKARKYIDEYQVPRQPTTPNDLTVPQNDTLPEISIKYDKRINIIENISYFIPTVDLSNLQNSILSSIYDKLSIFKDEIIEAIQGNISQPQLEGFAARDTHRSPDKRPVVPEGARKSIKPFLKPNMIPWKNILVRYTEEHFQIEIDDDNLHVPAEIRHYSEMGFESQSPKGRPIQEWFEVLGKLAAGKGKLKYSKDDAKLAQMVFRTNERLQLSFRTDENLIITNEKSGYYEARFTIYI